MRLNIVIGFVLIHYKTKSVKDVRAHLLLRIFSRMSRMRHASQTTKVNTMLKVQIFSTRMQRESVWRHGIAVDPGLLGNVTQ